MKIKISMLTFGMVLFFATMSMAQSSGGGNPTIGLSPSSILWKESRLNATTVEKKNVVKIGFFGLFGLDPHLAYERVLTDKTTLQINVAFIGFKDNIPFTDVEGEQIDANVDTRLSIFTLTPEYRIYFSQKDVPRGFYLGPYLRYARYNFDLSTDVETTNDNGEPETIAVDVDGSMNTTGLGLQLGVQWVIKDKVTIDWSFLGLGFNRYQLNVVGTSDAENVDYQQTAQDIEDNLEDIPFIGRRVKFDATNNSIEATVPFYSMALRGNLKVGFLF